MQSVLPVHRAVGPRPSLGRRVLLAVAAGRSGKRDLSRMVQRSSYEGFDHWIFAYDGTRFDEPVFRGCRVIREPGVLCHFHKRHLTPSAVSAYDIVMPWVDDVDIGDFSFERFLDIFSRNRLEVAQPALTHRSVYSHRLTLRRPGIGRLTDYTETMVQVFTREAWRRYWWLLEADRNPWGWGYAAVMGSFCGLGRMGIIDSEPVTHLRKRSWRTDAKSEKERLLRSYAALPQARFVTLEPLR